MNRLVTRLALALTLVALAAAGCGDDDDDSAGGGGGDSGGGGGAYGSAGGGGSDDEQAKGGETLRLVADPGGMPSFDKTSLSAAPGKVTIVLDNPSTVPHAIEVEGGGVEEVGDTVTEGGVSKASAELEAGTYEYYCPVGNHAQEGMEGTLTVE
jgi:plastocyanin